MTQEEIISLLVSPSKNTKTFERLQVIELCEIMDFCKNTFRNDKGNWSVNLTSEFCKEKKGMPYDLFMNLLYFNFQYKKRKKVNKGFSLFLQNLDRHVNTKGILKPRTGLPTLNDSSKIKLFLEEMKTIRTKYLNATDEQLLKFINNGIETGLKDSTLRNYFYKPVDTNIQKI